MRLHRLVLLPKMSLEFIGSDSCQSYKELGHGAAKSLSFVRTDSRPSGRSSGTATGEIERKTLWSYPGFDVDQSRISMKILMLRNHTGSI